MANVLETLWYAYLMDESKEKSKAREQFFERLLSCEGEVKENFTEEQIEILKRFRDCREGLARIDEYEAFAKGVRFATQYLLEATGKE